MADLDLLQNGFYQGPLAQMGIGRCASSRPNKTLLPRRCADLGRGESTARHPTLAKRDKSSDHRLVRASSDSKLAPHSAIFCRDFRPHEFAHGDTTEFLVHVEYWEHYRGQHQKRFAELLVNAVDIEGEYRHSLVLEENCAIVETELDEQMKEPHNYLRYDDMS